MREWRHSRPPCVSATNGLRPPRPSCRLRRCSLPLQRCVTVAAVAALQLDQTSSPASNYNCKTLATLQLDRDLIGICSQTKWHMGVQQCCPSAGQCSFTLFCLPLSLACPHDCAPPHMVSIELWPLLQGGLPVQTSHTASGRAAGMDVGWRIRAIMLLFSRRVRWRSGRQK